MDRILVNSRSLAEVGYEAATETLEVLFRNGGLYRYHRVPASTYARLLNAPSRGRFLNLHIKDRYKATKMAPGPVE